MTQAVIVGGGIAGPVAAMALRRIGISVALVEARQPDAAELGSWLTLQANGIDALRAVDAHGLVAELGFPTRTIRFVNGRGRSLGRMSNGAVTPDGVSSQMVRRADLYRVLRDEAVRRGATVTFGRRLVDATSTVDGVVARFDDGSELAADLLVGADGIRSATRRIIDPAAVAPRYVPVLNLGGLVPGLALDTPTDEFQMMFGTRCFFGWTSTPDGDTVWFANPPHREEPARGELEAKTDDDWRRLLLGLAGDDAGPIRRVIEAAPAPLVGWATYDVPRVETWYRGNMIVIGDAAHATAPSAGQGASLALEDAVLLGMALRDNPDVPSAFAAYEARRRERVEKIVAAGARSSNTKAAGPVARILRDAMLPVVFRLASRNDSASSRWITDHHIEWEA